IRSCSARSGASLMAIDMPMASDSPNNVTATFRRWMLMKANRGVDFIEVLMLIVPEIPLFSNVYRYLSDAPLEIICSL
ncbi:MAG TPA: hypothetical protein PKN45_05035, partial [Candidatus Limiplasma sp.]|nr:hypothetical protein [Candidatus Limiplasma sp.]